MNIMSKMAPEGVSNSAKRFQMTLSVVLLIITLVTFHRAFDMGRQDPIEALRILADAGVSCLLTSGKQQSCDTPSALNVLHQLVTEAKTLEEKGQYITILAGGGINSANLVKIVQKTGVHAVHGTCGRVAVASKMTYQRRDIFMGAEKENSWNTEYDANSLSLDDFSLVLVDFRRFSTVFGFRRIRLFASKMTYRCRDIFMGAQKDNSWNSE